jgi:hypothetical protein
MTRGKDPYTEEFLRNGASGNWRGLRIAKLIHKSEINPDTHNLAVAIYNGRDLLLFYEVPLFLAGGASGTLVRRFSSPEYIIDPKIGMGVRDGKMTVLIGDRTDDRYLEEGMIFRAPINKLQSLTAGMSDRLAALISATPYYSR